MSRSVKRINITSGSYHDLMFASTKKGPRDLAVKSKPLCYNTQLRSTNHDVKCKSLSYSHKWMHWKSQPSTKETIDTSRAKLLNAASHQQVEHMEDIAQNFTLTNGHNQERHCNNHKVNSYSIHMWTRLSEPLYHPQTNVTVFSQHQTKLNKPEQQIGTFEFIHIPQAV